MKRILILTILLLTTSVFASDIIKEEVKNAPTKVTSKDGFHSNLSISSNFIFANSKDVIGQQDGTNITIGFASKGGFTYLKGANEVLFNMNISEQFTRTPELERFIKSSDLAKFDTSYLYHVSSVWGPFAKLALDTSLLPGYSETKDKVNYKLPDGLIKNTKSMKLVSSLQPMIIKETVGLFYRPIDKKAIYFQVNAGAGTIQTIADGGYIVKNDDATPEIDLMELKSYNELGSSIYMDLHGTIKTMSVIDYKATLELMTPFLNDDPQKRAAGELTNIDFNLTLSSKITSWLSLNYELKIIKKPQLLDKYQIQNTLMISLNYILLGK